MLRHVVLLTLSEDTPDGQRAVIVEELQKLPAIIPEILSYSVGTDAGISDGNADVVVIGEFADVDGYQTYATNAEHVAVIVEHIKPWLAGRAAVQYSV